MNIEIINEIKQLKEEGRSYTEIADLIGISKAVITISLRVHSIVENDFKSIIEELSNANSTLIEKLKTSEEEKERLAFEVKRLNSLDASKLHKIAKEQSDEIEKLTERIFDMEETIYMYENQSLLEVILKKLKRGA